jgi:hypothetical protein
MDQDNGKPERKKKVKMADLPDKHALFKNDNDLSLPQQHDELFANIRTESQSTVFNVSETLSSQQLSNNFQDFEKQALYPTPTWDDLTKRDEEIANLKSNIKDLERLVKLLQNNKRADYIT